MSDEAPRHEITRKRVRYELPGEADVVVRRDVPYRLVDGRPLGLDVYSPPDSAIRGAVLIVVGYSDIGARRIVGCAAKEMDSFSSWAKLVAASGMVALVHETGTDPVGDARAAFSFVRDHAAELGVDPRRIGLFGCSGHAPNALGLLMGEPPGAIRCAALAYACTLDLDGGTAIGDGAKAFGYRNPTAGKTIADLPSPTELLLVRAGRDEVPGLNAAMDRFVAHALAANLPISLVNHAEGVHAFELHEDSMAARRVVAGVLDFFTTHLSR